MFDFLTDNPAVIFFIAFGLYRMFKAKKETKPSSGSPIVKSPNAADEARKRALALQSKSRPADERLEELARTLQAKLEGKPVPVPPTPAIRTAPTEPLTAIGERLQTAPSALEAAAIELGTVESPAPELVTERQTALEKIDYDLGRKQFEYHSAIEEPDAARYHLDAFTGFKPVAAIGVAPEEHSKESVIEEIGAPVLELFGGPDDVVRAFVLSEVLARPISLRHRRATRPGGGIRTGRDRSH